mmetsp:Transcript_22523/g.49073  ORF Transcript_22523/g.49073 Transcript_22523/m.49073 type:complete len:270 (-) Transcript_22523:156-965(-)|eukprot:CAMPEP_0168743836 /NCGR_PEP_ID=MMETSP0724-20121128/13784_1 /TAXON_ID=265536 /ORGANISM="Amphiprora sp., Strain CCMP467" /LENGTH=269 /DNA_ID=CAMNT_0008791483 /DNA_START=70 /DNA_END=879 /DNA_ORIENTATION=-
MPEQWTPLFNGASGEHYLGQVVTTDVGNEYHCDLTGTVCFGLKEWQDHIASVKFQNALQKTRDDIRHFFQLRDLARQQCPQILALQHRPWQDACFSKMARCLVNDEDETLITQDIDPLLQDLELLETISLLELAVWKALCCANCPDDVTGYFGFQQWLKEGWKSKKGQYRRSGEVVAIMKSVMPFVDQGQGNNENDEDNATMKKARTTVTAVQPKVNRMINVLEEKHSASAHNVPSTISTTAPNSSTPSQKKKLTSSTKKKRSSFPDVM